MKTLSDCQAEVRISSVKGRCLNTGRTHFKKGMTPWNKGKRGVQVAWNKGTKGVCIPWNKGKKGVMPPAWNKGLHIYMGGKRFVKGQIAPNKGKHIEKISGDKHWNWQGGKTAISQALRNSLEYEQWRIAVFERDLYMCVLCEAVGEYLHADHIKRWADYPELRFDVNNGRTLCESCHFFVTFNKILPEGKKFGRRVKIG